MQNLKLLTFLLLEMTSQKPLTRRERVIMDRYLPPGNDQDSRKIIFMSENVFSGPKLYLPTISLVFEQSKKLICSIFRDVPFIKPLQRPPGEPVLLKFF